MTQADDKKSGPETIVPNNFPFMESNLPDAIHKQIKSMKLNDD
jgi:hypothetical protein